MARPRIFSIPAGVPFLPTFVDALLAGEIVSGVSREAGPFALADTTIYVPTRRAARALLAEFARKAETGATALPKVLPLGAVDEEATLIADAADSAFALDPDLPDAIGEIERRFILAEMILHWSSSLAGAIVRAGPGGALEVDAGEAMVVGATPADALALAGDLAGLIDEFIVEGAPWSEVRHLAADDYDGYWAITATFLKIAIENWPDILEQRERIDAADRRARLIEREVERLAANGSREPKIVLGSTGTNRATARLMRAIARLERGAIVLPGLDLAASNEDWRTIAGRGDEPPAFGHPQAALARLLERLDAERDDVRPLGAPAPALKARMELVSKALAPSEATADWRDWRQGRDAEIAEALADVELMECADEREEALAIAIALRQALETPGASAALVTPDRSIARRVRAELARWRLDVDDSGGEPLAVAPAGILARTALAAAQDASDVALVALLAPARVAPAHDRALTQRLAEMLEAGVLRAVAHDADIARRIDKARAEAGDYRAHRAARAISDEQWREIGELAAAMTAALAPLRDIGGKQPVAVWIAAHRECLARLSVHAAPDDSDDGRALSALLDEAGAAGAGSGSAMRLELADYVALFDTLLSGAAVRGPQRSHPRLKILGLLEARLLDADLIVLAGLDETVWPPQPRSDPFLNRPMRTQIGLTPPERRIGQSAHDFAMAIGAPRVLLTRAAKRGGTPTVASRFLQRLGALSGLAFDEPRRRGQRYMRWARDIETSAEIRPIAPPAPRPPLHLRPDALSVTRIEVLRRDPYAVYAERILKLAPMGALDAEVDASDQGVAIHAVLRELSARWPTGAVPDDARDILIAAAREKLAAFFEDPTWRAFRWPNVEAGLDFVLRYERSRRPDIAHVHGEIRGEHRLTLSDGSEFKLSAVADRIEIDANGFARIIDYKTGTAPTPKQAKAGLASQLTLEASMLSRDAFSIGATETETAYYLKLGGADGGKQVAIVAKKGAVFADLVVDHWAELGKMLDSYRNPEQPYPSRVVAQYATRYGDYDHLARVKEWSAAGEPEGGE